MSNHTIERATLDQVIDTSLQGTVTATYAQLVERFGEPSSVEPDNRYEQGGEKVSAEWFLVIDDVTVTIYDWKESVGPYDVTDWHVGGHYASALDVVVAALEGS